jgi:hypothetical protein
MTPAIIAQLIIAFLPVAEDIAFNIGGKIIKINTATLTDQASIVAAFKAAADEGFPVLTFGLPETTEPVAGTSTVVN